MSRQGHHGWGRFPSSKIITISQTCLCRKFTLISALVDAWPLHPLTGNFRGPTVVGNCIQYIWGYPYRVGISYCFISPESLPCWVFQYTASNPTSMYSSLSGHCTLTVFLAWYVSTSSITRRSYDASDWVPAARKRQQIVLTVFLNFFDSLTLSNSLARVSNAPYNQTGSVDVTKTSSS